MITTTDNHSKLTRLELYFLRSIMAILAFTCVAKIISAFGQTTLLRIPNDVLPLTNGQVMLAAAVLEGFVLVMLAFGGQAVMKLAAVLWLCSTFAAYRIAAELLTGGQAPCPCLGSLTARLQITDVSANRVMGGLLCYMAAGSVAFLILRRWLTARGERTSLSVQAGEM